MILIINMIHKEDFQLASLAPILSQNPLAMMSMVKNSNLIPQILTNTSQPNHQNNTQPIVLK